MPDQTTVLIAEDSPTQAEHLTSLLEEHNFRVIGGHDGREAYELALKLAPDVVISDVVMPEMDGYALCRAIKSHPALRNTPVILVTSLSSPHDVFKGLDAGADNFIVKPYHPDDLLSRIGYLLANRHQRKTDGPQAGIQIELGGQRHLITADRQQILDLLISTYDQAIRLNDELQTHQRELANLNAQLEGEVAVRTEGWRQANEILEAMLDSLPIAIISVDSLKRVVTWNRSAETIFGYTTAEVLGESIPMRTVHLVEEIEAMHKNSMLGGAVKDVETKRQHKDGHLVDVRISASPLYDLSGSTRGAVLAIEDITARKQAEQRLRQVQKMEVLGELTGGIAHDFNNLLTIVIGNLDLLELMLADNAKAKGKVESARHASLRGADLTRQLLAFARSQPLEPKVVELNELIAGMVNLLGRTLGENIQISFVQQPEAWHVRADPALLDSAILNLALNARDAMPEGGKLTIELRNCAVDQSFRTAEPLLATGEYVGIDVTDTGTGIAPEHIDHIFEPFFTTKQIGRGTGLGLAMVYGFAAQSDGHVSVYSEVGHGTKFRLYLPRSTQTPTAEPKGQEQLAQLRGDDRILVVEDDEAICALVEQQLAGIGYTVLTAHGADEALSMLMAGAEARLLFSDVMMPGSMNGLGLAHEVSKRWPAMKILLTSGFTATTLQQDGSADGFAILNKPYRTVDLAQKIHETLLS